MNQREWFKYIDCQQYDWKCCINYSFVGIGKVQCNALSWWRNVFCCVMNSPQVNPLYIKLLCANVKSFILIWERKIIFCHFYNRCFCFQAFNLKRDCDSMKAALDKASKVLTKEAEASKTKGDKDIVDLRTQLQQLNTTMEQVNKGFDWISIIKPFWCFRIAIFLSYARVIKRRDCLCYNHRKLDLQMNHFCSAYRTEGFILLKGFYFPWIYVACKWQTSVHTHFTFLPRKL